MREGRRREREGERGREGGRVRGREVREINRLVMSECYLHWWVTMKTARSEG